MDGGLIFDAGRGCGYAAPVHCGMLVNQETYKPNKKRFFNILSHKISHVRKINNLYVNIGKEAISRILFKAKLT